MSKILYVEKRFGESSSLMINQANQIIDQYQAQGYKLTLRQLYYQFVSRDLIPNKVSEYKRLGGVVSDARLAGLIDWEAIEDRTRELAGAGTKDLPHWDGPEHIMRAAAHGYLIDKWINQTYRVEIWIEKEALSGVFEKVARELDIPYLCCRGYTSQSEMWLASQRLIEYSNLGQTPIILHFGDHDPSGIDMTRDIQDRLHIFNCDMELERLALNMDQVEKYDPPPNPAKETDSRFQGYIERFGEESWELDALEPQILADLVRKRVMKLIDKKAWKQAKENEEADQGILINAADRWDEVKEFLGE